MEKPFRLKNLLFTLAAGVLYGALVLGVFGTSSGDVLQEAAGLGAGLLFAIMYYKFWLKGCREKCVDEEGNWIHAPAWASGASRQPPSAFEELSDDDGNDGGDASWFASLGSGKGKQAKKGPAAMEEDSPDADVLTDEQPAKKKGFFSGWGSGSSSSKPASSATMDPAAAEAADEAAWYDDGAARPAPVSTKAAKAAPAATSSGLLLEHRSAGADDENPFTMADHSAYSVDAMLGGDDPFGPPQKKAPPPPPPAEGEDDAGDDVEAWLQHVQQA